MGRKGEHLRESNKVPPQDFELEDLEWEISDGLYRRESVFWEPLIEVTSSYVSNFEIRESVEDSLLAVWDESKGNVEAYRDSREEFISRLAGIITETDVSRRIQPQLARLGPRYEFHQDYINKKIVEKAREEFELRREGFRGHIAGRWAADAAEWIGLAVSSGIAGNLAYDVLKGGWITTRSGRLRNLFRRRREGLREVDPNEALEYLVKIAVRERCRRLDFPVPAIEELTFASWDSGPESVVASVVTISSRISATVEVPYSGMETRGLLVSVSYSQ